MTRLGFAAAVLLAAASPGAAKVAKYDFTGTWTGTFQEKGKSPVPFTARLTSAKPGTLAGDLTFSTPEEGLVHCTADGKQHGNTVLMHVKCDNSIRATVRGKIGTGTVSGSGFVNRPGKKRKQDKFQMSRQS